MFGLHPIDAPIFLVIAIWIAALIHCARNKKLQAGEKVAWILFSIFTTWIGALIYFLYWYGFAKQRRSQPPLQAEQNVPLRAHNGNESYSPYEQGYQPVSASASRAEPVFVDVVEQENSAIFLEEQPQVMYPEDPS